MARAEEICRELRAASAVELLSIDPGRGRGVVERVPAAEYIDRFRVLGRLAVTETAVREALSTSILNAVHEQNGRAAGCIFQPRHGIRFVSSRGTFEVLICFHCEYMKLRQSDEAPAIIKLTRTPQPLFDEAFARAGIPKPAR